MEVLGRDSIREGYRVAAEIGGTRVTGLVPDTLISDRIRLTGGRGHQTAYDWLARHERQILNTLTTLHTGTGRISAPYDRVTLERE